MPKIKCPNCKYEWDTNSKLDSVTCPNCQKKFMKEDEDDEEIEEFKNCMICNKELEIKDNEFKNAYLIQVADCYDYCSDDSGSTRPIEVFLLCEDCFEKYGTKALDPLFKLKDKANEKK